MTVKYVAEIDKPTIPLGYIVDVNTIYGMNLNSKSGREVQKWIDEGNTPEDAYTQAELDVYAASLVPTEVKEAQAYLDDTAEVYATRQEETALSAEYSMDQVSYDNIQSQRQVNREVVLADAKGVAVDEVIFQTGLTISDLTQDDQNTIAAYKIDPSTAGVITGPYGITPHGRNLYTSLDLGDTDLGMKTVLDTMMENFGKFDKKLDRFYL